MLEINSDFARFPQANETTVKKTPKPEELDLP